MRVSRALLAVPLAVALVACGGDDRPADDTFGTEEAVQSPAVTDAPSAPSGGAVAFRELNESGVDGDVTFAARDGETEIRANIAAGGPPYSNLAGHVHAGSCDAPGAPVHPLEPIPTQSGGYGEAITILEVPLAEIADGNHVVVYHGAGGAPIACAEVRE
jgi:hypothetical protein